MAALSQRVTYAHAILVGSKALGEETIVAGSAILSIIAFYGECMSCGARSRGAIDLRS